MFLSSLWWGSASRNPPLVESFCFHGLFLPAELESFLLAGFRPWRALTRAVGTLPTSGRENTLRHDAGIAGLSQDDFGGGELETGCECRPTGKNSRRHGLPPFSSCNAQPAIYPAPLTGKQRVGGWGRTRRPRGPAHPFSSAARISARASSKPPPQKRGSGR